MHKAMRITILLVLGLTMAGCGSSNGANPGSGNINGAWTATLKNADGSIFSQFSATLTKGTGSELSITNLTFTIPSPCRFSGGWGAGGSFTPTNGTFGMSMAAENVGGPMLTLQGTLSNGMISGMWSASGLVPPCSGSGTFTIQPSMAG
jgi:hypothetical protein